MIRPTGSKVNEKPEKKPQKNTKKTQKKIAISLQIRYTKAKWSEMA